MSESVLREVYMASNPADAHVVKLYLADEGISARIAGEQLQSAMGNLPPGQATAPRLLVLDADYEKAKLLVDRMESLHRYSDSLPELTPWVCPKCGESVDGTFDICWNCQYDRVSD
ncbi:DUF2007 domain-containing protein [bacterium]|nr:DUF2007 domain-containing protein [bacterium]